MISRGGHRNLAIRELVQNSDLETKALDQFLGSRKLTQSAVIPKKLTKENIMSLLYENSSLTEQQSSMYYSQA